MAAKKLPIEDRVLKLIRDGLGDKEVAEKVGTTPNHVWAIRAASGVRPVSERQLEIARRIVQRKRQDAPARLVRPVAKAQVRIAASARKAATPDPKRARRSSK